MTRLAQDSQHPLAFEYAWFVSDEISSKKLAAVRNMAYRHYNVCCAYRHVHGVVSP